ncbi:zinc finger protein 431 isoform X2 [Contarinia nasturtii]|uniref:zinc finger protein 431 isoform X2 n=1 Tax=Contarinia nasturtii TaxID=265458 RepID=UPI0012D3C59C|nr:zinc finger protein 431 isoform X2 [Contarinia nasturtii]
MGLLLSILFSYVGAVELMFIVRDIVHQVGLHHERMKINRSPSKATSLLDLQNDLRKSIKSAQEHLCETDSIHSMADGVLYDQGYRILSDDEQNIAKNWLEARANVTIEPLHSIKLNIKDNYGAEAVTNSCNQYEELVSQDDSLRSSSLSLDTIIENQKNSFQIENNHLSDNSDKNEMLNIHFDEYSQDYSYPSDEITKKGQRKNEDARRRKSYKMFTVGHSGADILQRRRSEDVDGETQNPWGELNPKSFHDDSLWRRERTMSIDENEESVGFVNGKSNENFKHAPETCNNISSNSKNIIETMIVHGLNKSDLIFSGEYTKAMNQDWHASHFSCWNCDESLTGQRYVLRDENPYCIKCYENVFANTCDECNKIIGIDSKDLSYKEKHWHEACFLCNKCRVSLVDKQFGSKAEKIYCGNCYDSQFASRCDGCGEVFRAGTKKMEYKTRQWHEKCFSCCVCKNPIGTKSFIPKEQEIYCAGCYEEKYATRCIKCSKIITSGGVTYKNDPWHRECFTCTHCTTSLAGQRFTSRDEKPYCADCFGELFAKRCTSCTKPITGIGGTRFISFEDRHWHNDCFICASCKTSLVGRGFITDEADIICPECAKAKLM